MLDMLRGALAPLGLVVSAVDRSLATGGFNNAREAAGDSRLRRAAWNGVIVHGDEERKAGSAA